MLRHAIQRHRKLLAIALVGVLAFMIWGVFLLRPAQFTLENSIDDIVFVAPDTFYLVNDHYLARWQPDEDQLLKQAYPSVLERGVVTVRALAHHGQLVASAIGNGQVELWSTTDEQRLTAFNAAQSDMAVWLIAWNPDDTLLAIARQNWAHPDFPYEVQIWNTTTYQLLQILTGARSPLQEPYHVRAVTWHPTEPILAILDSGVLRLWDVETNTLVAQEASDTFLMTAVAWSASGRHLMSHTTLYQWDGLKLVKERDLVGPEDSINSIAFSPDQRFIAAGTGSHHETGFGYEIRDTAVYLWDFDTGTLLERFNGHEEIVGALAFNEGGTILVSGDQDGVVYTWSIKR
jgi:WD40 repeat protein